MAAVTRAHWRPAWAEVDLAAVRHNASVLARLSAPAPLCAVVKADGYGHGAAPVARAALEGGASWLAVALVEEGVALRAAGIDAPILLLSEAPGDATAEAVAARLVPTVYTRAGIRALGEAARAQGDEVEVHLKVDTGMHRVGCDPDEAPALARLVADEAGLRLHGVWTHLAVADGTSPADRAFTEGQLASFDAVLSTLAAAGHQPVMAHAANSAGAIAHPTARRDLTRCGIALYGELPAPGCGPLLAHAVGDQLRPALSLRARVTYLRELGAGARPSYGRHRPLAERSVVAVVPIGYADGVPRRLFETGGSVLIGGIPRLLAGMVTMDQIVVDLGLAGTPAADAVAVGDEVVLLGSQGGAAITASEWAERLGTISYEVLCGIGPRVPRVVVDDGSGQSDRQTGASPGTAAPAPGGAGERP